jgi:glyoxylase-like metal-dependent hydrolase (beta-lactamase superfamily II)
MPGPVSIERIELPVPYLGSVNLWLLRGSPLTLVDTGPGNTESLQTLEWELEQKDVRLADLELVLLTHHHLDHSGLAGAIRERSGARVAALAETAAWGRRYHARSAVERVFTGRLLEEHGVPGELAAGVGPFYDYIVANSARFEADDALADGDIIRAGDRVLRVIHRPGHSTTDTIYVDDDARIAFVGDHLLAHITSNAELTPAHPERDERRRALLDYLPNLRLTVELPVDLCLAGHGPEIHDHSRLIAERLAFHSQRLEEILAAIDPAGSTAFEIAERLWPVELVAAQTVLAIWEVVGHLDLLGANGAIDDDVDDHGHRVYRTTRSASLAAAVAV